jgi:hypothetical protein
MRRCISQKGQGLMETIVTVLIVSITIIALMHFQTRLSYTHIVTQQQNEASTLASSKLDTLRDFSILGDYDKILSGQEIVQGSTTTYTVTWTVTTHRNYTYKSIDLSVTWKDIRGQIQKLDLSTAIAGLNPPDSAFVMLVK